ncbi:RWD domain-containing protein 1 [Neocloeon triangulifer]|uniref:RWD domain-containing protein 1 n=1 Tax=Neocloeon triangulifer TaxID=2078957 RepID=UPI00286F4431|nr:RWD domain-containing protein 1 [Neocloeon triangulifer]XP_059477441.1 RWD domain-containing protein 1 [Neocloeon triangulifer]
MDHHEEQVNEIEALDSIYCGEFEILSKLPFHQFMIPVRAESDENDICLSCNLQFTYTPKYPEEIPEIEVLDAENFEETKRLVEHLKEVAQENVGMVMIFTLVSAALEWLNQLSDKIKSHKEEAERKRVEAEEEAERKRFEGTRVSVETFLKWKKAFDEEMSVFKKKEKEKDSKKLTGRELFLQDKTLNESDLKFLEEGDDFKVDETLFEDLDELDLDEIDDEDHS